MSGLQEAMERAMRAHGMDPDEVRIAAQEIDLDAPERTPEPEPPAVPSQEKLMVGFEGCERCGDAARVFDFETGDEIPCPKCS